MSLHPDSDSSGGRTPRVGRRASLVQPRAFAGDENVERSKRVDSEHSSSGVPLSDWLKHRRRESVLVQRVESIGEEVGERDPELLDIARAIKLKHQEEEAKKKITYGKMLWNRLRMNDKFRARIKEMAKAKAKMQALKISDRLAGLEDQTPKRESITPLRSTSLEDQTPQLESITPLRSTSLEDQTPQLESITPLRSTSLEDQTLKKESITPLRSTSSKDQNLKKESITLLRSIKEAKSPALDPVEEESIHNSDLSFDTARFKSTSVNPLESQSVRPKSAPLQDQANPSNKSQVSKPLVARSRQRILKAPVQRKSNLPPLNRQHTVKPKPDPPKTEAPRVRRNIPRVAGGRNEVPSTSGNKNIKPPKTSVRKGNATETTKRNTSSDKSQPQITHVVKVSEKSKPKVAERKNKNKLAVGDQSKKVETRGVVNKPRRGPSRRPADNRSERVPEIEDPPAVEALPTSRPVASDDDDVVILPLSRRGSVPEPLQHPAVRAKDKPANPPASASQYKKLISEPQSQPPTNRHNNNNPARKKKSTGPTYSATLRSKRLPALAGGVKRPRQMSREELAELRGAIDSLRSSPPDFGLLSAPGADSDLCDPMTWSRHKTWAFNWIPTMHRLGMLPSFYREVPGLSELAQRLIRSSGSERAERHRTAGKTRTRRQTVR